MSSHVGYALAGTGSIEGGAEQYNLLDNISDTSSSSPKTKLYSSNNQGTRKAKKGGNKKHKQKMKRC
ncbi:hypothetical protein TSUD_278110 [Trifolium subterraneum]|uniref:Uncharacterized protein n=1 Tax=Trifolium subterraneum TaxID=3900 RepID=A0A2Z6M955_TRISU|nr:hypothetical protein TSUD_278110 [Trifolium subterraneum]